jgi:hypothetical protein
MNGQNLPFSELKRLAELASDDLAALTGCDPARVDRAMLASAFERLVAVADGGDR